MNWKDELAAEHAADTREARLEALPAFVRGHRLATMDRPSQDGVYEGEATLVAGGLDALDVAEVVTSWTGDMEEPPVAAGPNDWSALAHLPETFHRPILDLDFDAALVPSSSADHHHLYLDKVLTWSQYVKLLDVLAEVGIIEPGYRDASVAREFTSVRLPWVTKANGPANGDYK
jgi:hypothetical protein